MECFRCREGYDEELRRPKLLPCGHVFCQPCLQTTDRCFSDGKAFPKAAQDLPDDLFTLGLLRVPPPESEDAADSAGVSLWCQTCSATASEACLDSQDDAEPHALRSMRRHRHEVLLGQLEAVLAALERPSAAPMRADSELAQLASSGQAEISFDGQADPSATVQLGGSCAEDSELAWAVQQLLLRLPDAAVPEPAAPTPPPPAKAFTAAADDVFPTFDLFGDDPLAFEDFDDDDEEESTPAVASQGDGVELDLTLTADPQPGPEALARVRRVVNLSCKTDPPRTLALLEAVAPHLEELQLVHADRAHLAATLRMPKLWRLEAFGVDACADPFVVPAALPHDGGLRVLQVCLCPPTVASLARAHQRTLERVVVMHPVRPRRPPTCRFENLDYRGGGRLALPRFKRNPYFPARAPGEFPALKSIEFEEAPYDGGEKAGTAPLRAMFPGVHVGAPKNIRGWGQTVRSRLKSGKHKT